MALTQEFISPSAPASGQNIAIPLSWVVEIVSGADLSGTQFIVHLSDGTADNRVLLYSSAGVLRVQARQSAANRWDAGLGTLETSTPYRVAVAWASGAFGASLDGGEPTTSDVSADERTYTVYHFGASTGGTAVWSGSVDLVQEFGGTTFTPSELQIRSGPGALMFHNSTAFRHNAASQRHKDDSLRHRDATLLHLTRPT